MIKKFNVVQSPPDISNQTSYLLHDDTSSLSELTLTVYNLDNITILNNNKQNVKLESKHLDRV